MARRIRIDPFPALDLLELFAFVYPARFCIPTPGGLAQELGLMMLMIPLLSLRMEETHKHIIHPSPGAD